MIFNFQANISIIAVYIISIGYAVHGFCGYFKENPPHDRFYFTHKHTTYFCINILQNRMITTWKDDVWKKEASWIWERRLPLSEGSDSAEGQRNAAIAFVLPLLVSALISSATPCTTAYRGFFCPEHTTVRKLKHCKITVIHWKSQRIQLYIIIVNLCQVLMIRSCRPHRKTAFGREHRDITNQRKEGKRCSRTNDFWPEVCRQKYQ